MGKVNSPQPLTLAAFQVLLALARGESHGYAVIHFVEWVSRGEDRLGAGTLYRTVARLLADGLIEEIEGHDPAAPHDARRRYYQLTPAGRLAAEAEARRLARLVVCAADAGLVPASFLTGGPLTSPRPKSLTPHRFVREVDKAVRFYREAFGAAPPKV